MRSIERIRVLENIPVLVRAALNVPIKDGEVAGSFRLRQALPTIEYLRKRHARIVLIGHIGDQGTETLEPVYRAMQAFVPDIAFCPVTVGSQARAAVRALPPGGVLMLENLRRHPGEQKNDPELARSLAELADVFVEDSFDVCHRAHASVVGVPAFLPSYAGFQVIKEVDELRKALRPKRPALALVGGAKFSTKQPVLRKLLRSYDRVYVGGALANDFLKAEGFPVGASLVSDADPKELHALLASKKILLPLDYVVAPAGKTVAEGRVAEREDVREGEAILDNGPATLRMLAEHAEKAKTVLWNGPLGNYENGFTQGTEALAKVLAESSARSIVGGGDTVAAIEKAQLAHAFSFISTGGGAMLDYLAKGTLPGIEALT